MSSSTNTRKNARTLLRQTSKSVSEDGEFQILSSLQTCELHHNLEVLSNHLSRINRNEIYHHLQGAYALLELLLAKVPDRNGFVTQSYIKFDAAVDLFYGYSPDTTIYNVRFGYKRKAMKEFLCHPSYGIRVYIINDDFVLLKSNDTDIDHFIIDMYETEHMKSEVNRFELNRDTVKLLLDSMDSEWDQNVLRGILVSTRSLGEIENIGLRNHQVNQKCEDIIKVASMKNNIMVEAKNAAIHRIQSRLNQLATQIASKQHLHKKKILDWTSEQLEELTDTINLLESRRDEMQSLLLNHETNKIYKKRFSGMVRRAYKRIIDEKRFGRRKKSSGRKRVMDEEDERMLLKCIEEKTTAHGRRGDEIMYSSQRVKKKDFIKIVNYNHRLRGLPLIKSSSTPYNRSKPHNRRSAQAKRHIGFGLFCTRKSPKSGDTDNDLTHYQRAHKKIIVQYFYGNPDLAKYVFEISMDDKAYLCPGTGTGMTGARNVRTYQSANKETARKLPKYDFPISMVCVTPATYRIMTKDIVDVDGKERAVIEDDACFVFLRPKYFVGSSPSVWASEFLQLRYEQPHKFQVDANSDNSKVFKKYCIMLCDAYRYFIDSSEVGDVTRISSATNCPHRDYYNTRLLTILRRIWNASETLLHSQEMLEDETVAIDQIKLITEQIHQKLLYIKGMLEQTKAGSLVWVQEEELVPLLENAVILIDSHLPKLKSVYLEWTDAGPGVGITNHAVKYRAAQKIRISNIDYLIRHHLANDDSSHNEVERVQSYVGDAICDGGALEWEHKKLFHDFSASQLSEMTLEQFQELELKRMRYNANKICEEVASRVDGAPGPGGYLTGYSSKKEDNLFFLDHQFLTSFVDKGNNVPGSFYYSKLSSFIKLHFHNGLKYVEFIKSSCENGNQPKCKYCMDHPSNLPQISRVTTPYPDQSRLPELHYFPYNETPRTSENGEVRVVDDFNPRTNLTKLFDAGKIKLGDEDAIKRFSRKFVVAEKHVKSRLEHLATLQLKKKKKQKKRTEDKELSFDEINWVEHYQKNTLKTLKVPTLNKYLQAKKLTQHLPLKKGEKILIIQHSISFEAMGEMLMRQGTNEDADHEASDGDNDIDEGADGDNDIDEGAEDDSDDEDANADVEDDIEVVAAIVGDDDINDEVDDLNDDLSVQDDADDEVDNFEDDLSDQDDDISSIFTKTRSGRVAANWRASRYT